MPSIALFFAKHTGESETSTKLQNLTGFTPVNDSSIITEAAKTFNVAEEKLEKALYQKTSVFNKFTLERELHVAYLKHTLADKLSSSHLQLSGFISLLIPQDVSHVLKVLVADEKEKRISRAVMSGLETKQAEREIHKADIQAYHWCEFLHNLEPWDKSLYDIIIPASEKDSSETAAFIMEHIQKGNLLENRTSSTAVEDMKLSAEIEITLLKKGQKVGISAKNGKIRAEVNKAVLNFSALQRDLTDIINSIEGVKDVEVIMGKDYNDSIYRDQQFTLPPKVLLVDDEKDFVLTLSERLTNRNVGTFTVYDGQEALDFIKEETPDVMVLDLKMPGVNGIEVLKRTKKNNPDVEIIILTGHGTEEDKENCMGLGAFAYLQKPTDIRTLSETIHKAHVKSQQALLH